MIKTNKEKVSDWVEKFKHLHNRPLRVLHLGNIANNAYVNAKIMRRYGIEADVVSANYYHIMSCPEWEDADYNGKIDNDNFPNWKQVDLNGFKRPRWFVHGPTKLCIPYLQFKNNSNKVNAYFCLKLIDLYKHLYYSNSASAFFYQKSILPKLKIILPKLKIITLKSILLTTLKYIFYKLKSFVFSKLVFILKSILPKSIILRIKTIVIKKSLKRTEYENKNHIQKNDDPVNAVTVEETKNYFHELLNDFSVFFPNRTDQLAPIDIADYALDIDLWRELFKYYDIVQGYAIDGIYPLLANLKNFTTYEHGTLRDIPFQSDPLGRVCSLVYRKASAVFVTNTDCVTPALKLGINRQIIYPIPHAFDSEKIFKFLREWKPKTPVQIDPPLFIAPARHHWQNGTTSWLKGNDVIIHAISRLAKQGLKFKVIFINWGKEVSLSKQLIEDLAVTDYCIWLEPLKKKDLLIYFLKSVAVIDQFVIPAMGGVCFESLALGRPLITYMDQVTVGDFFGEVPPHYNAHTPEELSEAMKDIMLDPVASEQIGSNGQKWIEEYHSSERILAIQLEAYQKILDS